VQPGLEPLVLTADESSSSTLADLADEYAAWVASLENAHAQEHFEEGVRDLDEWTAHKKPSQTEMKDWFSEERVTAIQSMVKIGEDLAPDEKQTVLDLIAWYADIFTLSLSEVQTVNVVKHKLEVPAGTKLPTQLRSQPRAPTAPQLEFFHKQIDLLKQGVIITKIAPEYDQCLNSTNLASKDCPRPKLTKNEIKTLANEEAVRVDLLLPHDPQLQLLERVDAAMYAHIHGGADKPAKWRICHAFTALNRLCKIPSFPAGDLEVKKASLVAHEYYLVLDMHSGYFAIKMRAEDIPKTVFCVEGRGTYAYLHMPFGLHRAPLTYREVIALAFQELLRQWLKNWMDDLVGSAASVPQLLEQLKEIFKVCRQFNLSLSPCKAKIGIRCAPFGGSIIDKAGVHPNPGKVASILEYPRPATVHGVLMFLSAAGYFRNAIADFTETAVPLVKLTKGIQVMRTSQPGQWKD
jgi:hypothetical protein